jgi:3-isopropylmalate/(R)-2-methylmalate dehydratase small subunit
VIDVKAQKVTFAGQRAGITVRESARNALIHGRWDPIGELIEGGPDALKVASNLRYMKA